MANVENLNTELYHELHSKGYDPTILDSKGNEQIDPAGADVFRFHLLDDIGGKSAALYASIEVKGRDSKPHLLLWHNNDHIKFPTWEEFVDNMQIWSTSNNLAWESKNTSKIKYDMQKRTVMKKKENLGEGYYPISKKMSYSDNVPTVKIILQHSRQLEEGEQRFRNVERIFVETTNGERFLLPTNRPGLARVYARHISEGGTPYDDKAKHISTLVEEYTRMAGFVRATKNSQFNESTQRLVAEGINHYQNLRETLTRMTSQRGYRKYFESYTPVLNEESEDDVLQLNELFVEEKLDPRIESVLPILKRLSKNLNEMSEVIELAEWSASLLEGGDGAEVDGNVDGDTPGDAGEGGAEDVSEDLDQKKIASTTEVADILAKSLGNEEDLTPDDIYSAINEYQDLLTDQGLTINTDKVAQILFDRLSIQIDEKMDSTTASLAEPAEEMLDEAYINTTADAVNVLANLRKISKNIEIGNPYEGNLANEYVNDVQSVYTWLENTGANMNDSKLKPILADVFELNKKAKALETRAGSGQNTQLANQIVNTLYPLIQWIEMNVKSGRQGVAEGMPTSSMTSRYVDDPNHPAYKSTKEPEKEKTLQDIIKDNDFSALQIWAQENSNNPLVKGISAAGDAAFKMNKTNPEIRKAMFDYLRTQLQGVAENLDEAPGAMTLKHNQDTEKSNLRAFDLAEDRDHPAVSAITNRILRRHTDLLGKYGPEKVLAAIEDAAAGLGELEEIGSSDVSIWVNQIIKSLESGAYDHLKEGSGDAPIEKMTNEELADYLGVTVSFVKQDRNRAEQAARDKTDDVTEQEDFDDAEFNKMNIAQQTAYMKKNPMPNDINFDKSALQGNKDVEKIMKPAQNKDGTYSFSKGMAHGIDSMQPNMSQVGRTVGKALYRDMPGQLRKEKAQNPEKFQQDYDSLDDAGKAEVDRNIAITDKQAKANYKQYQGDLDKQMTDQGYSKYGYNYNDQPVVGRVKNAGAWVKDKFNEEDVEEDLDANQKRVGQLGPTEKVKNNNIGKLVGASESINYDDDQLLLERITKLAGK